MALSPGSLEKLATCDPRLQALVQAVEKDWDLTVLCGTRNQADQEAAFAAGATKVHFPNGRHNKNPSMAVDMTPFPINFDDKERLVLFAGLVIGHAKAMGLNIRWGGNWKQDWDMRDNSFNDLDHFEIKSED